VVKANFDPSCTQRHNTIFRLRLTVIQSAGKRGVMKTIGARPTVRVIAAMLVTVAVIGLSALAVHTPTQNQNPVMLKSIQTDKAATFYAGSRPGCAWFVEAVLPGTNDSHAAAENLKAVAATL
jgi:hypothetical protein